MVQVNTNITIFSSQIEAHYESCSAENDPNACTKCDPAKFRVLNGNVC